MLNRTPGVSQDYLRVRGGSVQALRRHQGFVASSQTSHTPSFADALLLVYLNSQADMKDPEEMDDFIEDLAALQKVRTLVLNVRSYLH